MKKLIGLAVLSVAFAVPAWSTVHAQAPAHADALISHEAAIRRHADGLAYEHHGDEKAAFTAYLEAAESGYPPAQRKLGEIYESGSAAVKRDFSASMQWYQKARNGGEAIPFPKSPMPTLSNTP